MLKFRYFFLSVDPELSQYLKTLDLDLSWVSSLSPTMKEPTEEFPVT